MTYNLHYFIIYLIFIKLLFINQETHININKSFQVAYQIIYDYIYYILTLL